MSNTHPSFPNAYWINPDEIVAFNEATYFVLRPTIDDDYTVECRLHDPEANRIQLRAGYRDRPDQIVAIYRDAAAASSDFCGLRSADRPLWYVGLEATMPVRDPADVSRRNLAELRRTRSVLGVGEIPNQYLDVGLLSTAIYFEFSPMAIDAGGQVMTQFAGSDTKHYQWRAGFGDRPAAAFRTFAKRHRSTAVEGFFELRALGKPLYYSGHEIRCLVTDKAHMMQEIQHATA